MAKERLPEIEDDVVAVDIKTMCKRWGVSRPTMMKAINHPNSPAFKIGTKWVLPLEAFDEFMYSLANERETKEAKRDVQQP